MNKIAEHFNVFAEDCVGSSELYECLSHEIARDDALLALSSYATDAQPPPNLLFGAVHYLLLKGKEHPLILYYPSIVEEPKPPQKAFPYFKDFCFLYQDKIIALLKEKYVQTNEVRRCGYLYPCFSYIYNKVKTPLAIIEIGTSAGFQLLWDTYHYSYFSSDQYGNQQSNIHIQTEFLGKNKPTIPKNPPPITHRYG